MNRNFALLLCALLTSLPAFAAPKIEELKITTYYPSPYGVYKMIQVVPSDMSTLPATECDADADRGKIMYDTVTNSMKVCMRVDVNGDGALTTNIDVNKDNKVDYLDNEIWMPILNMSQIGDYVDARQLFTYDGTKIAVNDNYKVDDTTTLNLSAPVDYGVHTINQSTLAQARTHVRPTYQGGKYVCPAGSSLQGTWCEFVATPSVTAALGDFTLPGTADVVPMFGIGTDTPQTLLDIRGSMTNGKTAINVNGLPLVRSIRITETYPSWTEDTEKDGVRAMVQDSSGAGISASQYYCVATSVKYKYTMKDEVVHGTQPTVNDERQDVRQAFWTYVSNGMWYVYVAYPGDLGPDARIVPKPAADIICFNKDIVEESYMGGSGGKTDSDV